MSDTLTLDPSGVDGCTPVENPWRPHPGPVKIKNNSGFEQSLTNITKGVLAAAPHGTITIAKGGEWSGTATGSKGTYVYDDGMADAGPRTGTIDPSQPIV
jgi:hypothetical protein